MKITTVGKGNIGGGLARLWEQAGHDVTSLGRYRLAPAGEL
jgi:predicted dinucleotide-binding enzyme